MLYVSVQTFPNIFYGGKTKAWYLWPLRKSDFHLLFYIDSRVYW